MPRYVCAMLLAASILPSAALAQPTRNANVWDGRAHQPSQGAVAGDEKAAGVAPSDQTKQRQDQTLDAMGRALTDKAQSGR